MAWVAEMKAGLMCRGPSSPVPCTSSAHPHASSFLRGCREVAGAQEPQEPQVVISNRLHLDSLYQSLRHGHKLSTASSRDWQCRPSEGRCGLRAVGPSVGFHGVLWGSSNLLLPRVTRNHVWVLQECSPFTAILPLSPIPTHCSYVLTTPPTSKIASACPCEAPRSWLHEPVDLSILRAPCRTLCPHHCRVRAAVKSSGSWRWRDRAMSPTNSYVGVQTPNTSQCDL